MRHLALGLFAEGSSDIPFLRRIIYRSVEENGTQLTQQRLEVLERFVEGDKYVSDQRAERIFEAFGKHVEEGVINLLFIHADGNGDPKAALKDRVCPAMQLLKETYRAVSFGIVPVIPVRETEAWALADAEALRAELGWYGNLPDMASPESLPDPKEVLKLIREEATPTARRRSRRQSSYVGPISEGLGDRISLRKLRQLDSFKRFEADLKDALRALWNLPLLD